MEVMKTKAFFHGFFSAGLTILFVKDIGSSSMRYFGIYRCFFFDFTFLLTSEFQLMIGDSFQRSLGIFIEGKVDAFNVDYTFFASF